MKRYLPLALLMLLAVILAFSTVWFIPLIKSIFFPGNETSFGEIGDMFGAVNAVFSGLAFAGVVIAIIIQEDELKQTRKEFEFTRLTTVVFKQIDRIDSFIQQLDIEFGTKYPLPKGISGIYQLNMQFGLDEILKARYSLDKIYNLVISSFEVIEKIVETSSAEKKYKKELKFLFYKNLNQEIITNILVFHKLSEKENLIQQLISKNPPQNQIEKIKEIVNKANRITNYIDDFSNAE
ncbi:MAG: hypothetical protein ACK4TA_10065 [Saprospiraceae bacterium]